MAEAMYTWSMQERLLHLMELRGLTKDEVVEGLAGKLSKSYVYYLLKGERENLSQETIEVLASFFNVSPLFFSRDPAFWVPPVSGQQIQYALRASQDLDTRAKAMLDQLAQRAQRIAAAEQDKKQGKK